MELQTKLESILGSNKVYYQAPTNVTFPCILYELADIASLKADNKKYKLTKKYKITLIHKNPDNDICTKLLMDIPNIDMVTVFKTEGLYHYVYELYLH